MSMDDIISLSFDQDLLRVHMCDVVSLSFDPD